MTVKEILKAMKEDLAYYQSLTFASVMSFNTTQARIFELEKWINAIENNDIEKR